MKQIQTPDAPQAIGPYSQAVEENNMVFCSGQLGTDPKTGELKQGIEEQTAQAITNLIKVLKAAECDLSQVVKTTVYLKNVDDFAKMNDTYAVFFSSNKPARATVEVARLLRDALVEIDAIAVKKVVEKPQTTKASIDKSFKVGI